MNRYLRILFIFILPGLAFAGDWVAVDGGVVEVDLKQNELEEALWAYLAKSSTKTFESRDKYTYQYQAISNDEIHINALCDTFDKQELNKQFVVVFDGGACFFQVNYNMRTGRFFQLSINGES